MWIALLGFFFTISPVYANPTLSPTHEYRIGELLRAMTLEEKIKILGGDGFATFGIPRLGIPPLNMTDGPLGVRWGRATSFPSAVAMGASFNPDLVREVAGGVADDTIAMGRHVLLGPCVNLHRNPFGGRNFESFGEDPLLAGRLGAAYIQGIQNKNVIATVKHFAINDQEYERHSINTIASERTLRELHFPAFEAAIEAGVWSVMAAYNRVNGQFATENAWLLNTVLKGEWGFNGFVVSDWEATHSTIPAARNGLDLEMPYGEHFNEQLMAAVQSGYVAESLIDDKIRRIFRPMFAMGLFDGPGPAPSGRTDSAQNQLVARRMSEESIVLLKNDGILPINFAAGKKIAVIGPNAAVARSGGGGSSTVEPFYKVSPYDGLAQISQSQLTYASGASIQTDVDPIPAPYLSLPGGGGPGIRAEYFGNRTLSGAPAVTREETTIHQNWGLGSPDPSIPVDDFSARWSADLRVPSDGLYALRLRSDDGVRVVLDGQVLVSDWQTHGTKMQQITVQLEAAKTYSLVVEYFEARGEAMVEVGLTPFDPERELIEAENVAKNSDMVLLFAGLSWAYESEGIDRLTLSLPENQIRLVDTILKANPNTVLILNSGTPIELGDFANRARAILQTWYYGQEGGNAIARVLSGAVNPSGKLPFTWINNWTEHSAYGNYPGANGEVEYREGIYLGYRHTEKRGIKPLFPFGYGLSYTSFAVEDARLETRSNLAETPDLDVVVTVRNTGQKTGKEVVQVYVEDDHASVDRPFKELKGFGKLELNPGEAQTIRLPLNFRSFAFFHPAQKRWIVEPGQFRIHVGTSSEDIARVLNLSLVPAKKPAH